MHRWCQPENKKMSTAPAVKAIRDAPVGRAAQRHHMMGDEAVLTGGFKSSSLDPDQGRAPAELELERL